MEEDENIKKTENELEYEEFTIENLTKKIKYLENLLKNKKLSQDKADKLFKK